MSSQTAMSRLMAEWNLRCGRPSACLFLDKKAASPFPCDGDLPGAACGFRARSTGFFYGQPRHWLNDRCFYYYYFVYWAVYIASAVLLFFVSIEVFRSALSLFPGLQRLGTVAFRWVALVSVIVSSSTLTLEPTQAIHLNTVACRLMRSVSLVELCLLAFLGLSMNALRLSVRSMAFGIALGFGLMSTSDFVSATFLSWNHSLTEPMQFVFESVILVVLGTWAAYAALPEPAPQAVLLPAKSILFRWNEIASALGHTGTQVAMRQPANGFLLSDVERAVEEALSPKGTRD